MIASGLCSCFVIFIFILVVIVLLGGDGAIAVPGWQRPRWWRLVSAFEDSLL